MANKRVLLTGIGGSIGIHTVAQIMRTTDWEVVGIDSFRHKGYTDRLSNHFEAHPEDRERVKIFTHDLVAPFSDMLKKKIGHIDYIISMASLSDVEDSIRNPVPFCLNNTALILYLLEYARECKPEAFIQISTDEVYGPTTGKNDGYTEWDRKIPSCPYASSKSAQEEYCIGWWKAFGVPLIITNTMNNFGEMQSASKYPVMIQKALANDEEITIHCIGDEIGSRSYIHSRNFADALIFLLKNVKPYIHVPGKVDIPDRFHIAGDIQLNNKELVEVIAELMGKSKTFKYKMLDVHSTRPGHDPHYGLKADKIKKLGWVSPVSFKSSLDRTIKWQKENPEWIN